MICVWAKAVNYGAPSSYKIFFLVFMWGLQPCFLPFKGSLQHKTKGYTLFCRAETNSNGVKTTVANSLGHKRAPASAACTKPVLSYRRTPQRTGVPSWSAWIYASHFHILVTASAVTSPYGGDGSTNYYSAVLLTHKNAIWQPCIV